jgi:hypothetical protein
MFNYLIGLILGATISIVTVNIKIRPGDALLWVLLLLLVVSVILNAVRINNK